MPTNPVTPKAKPRARHERRFDRCISRRLKIAKISLNLVFSIKSPLCPMSTAMSCYEFGSDQCDAKGQISGQTDNPASGQIVGIDSQAPGRNKPVTPFVSNLSYTALGQPKSWSWTSGDTAQRSFDQDARMTANEFASYTFDAASRITGISQNLWASLVTTSTATGTVTSSTSYYQTPINWAVTYDSRGRVTSFNRPSAQTGYTYDANSNRLSAINKKVSDIDLDGDFDQLDKAQTTAQALSIEQTSNKLQGFTQSLTSTRGTRTLSTTHSSVNYALDAIGNMTTDGLRAFSYDEANRHSQTSISKDGEAAKVTYLHNAIGQRVFKSEPQVDQTIPNESTLGTTYIDWLKKNFSWLFAAAQTNVTLGQSYVYADADAQLPSYAMLGEYGNGAASGAGRLEYIWLPTEDGQASPIGLFRGGKFYAVHSDHLNTPRLITDEANKAVWQWPYTAFGDNKPAGILKATQNPNNAFTQDPMTNARLQATNPAIVYNHRFAGQYFDSETGLHYNYFRNYMPNQGRYSQNDPFGLAGGSNRFGYVGGNPLSRTDPLGLFEVEGYPSSTFDKRKHPAKVQELYRYAAELQALLNKACPGNKKAQELFDKWVGKLSPRWSDPVTDYKTRATEFTAPFFDSKSYGFGKPSPSFVFMHEFMHMTDSNYAKSRSTSTGEYINAFTKGTSNDLPFEKHADQLVRDLIKGTCPCE